MTAAAPPRQTYSSPAIHERRRRILAEARILLGEGGANGFSIRLLSRRAGVSSRTLYTSFGDKEGILAAAVAEHVEELAARLGARSRSGHLADLFADFDEVVAEIARTPAYTHTLIELFYSLSPLKPALAAIRRLPGERLRRWLEATPAEELLPGLDHGWALAGHIDAELAIYHHWAVGLLSIDALAVALKRNFLRTLLVVTRDGRRAHVLALLETLSQSGATAGGENEA